MKTTKRANVFELVTNAICEKLEQGEIPWQRPFIKGKRPMNLITGKPYNGVNMLLCGGWSNPYFLTFNQCKQLKGSIKKGEKSTIIVFWKLYTKDKLNEETGELEEHQTYILNYYRVFNVTQCEGIDHKRLIELQEEYKTKSNQMLNQSCIDSFEQLTAEYRNKSGLDIEIGEESGRAFYMPILDFISLPDRKEFISDEAFVSTYAHELVHSTGNKSRLNRLGRENSKKGDESYSKEELVAEIGAGFLSNMVGIDHIENATAYCQSWLKALKNDIKMIVYASKDAEKAVDYILDYK